MFQLTDLILVVKGQGQCFIPVNLESKLLDVLRSKVPDLLLDQETTKC